MPKIIQKTIHLLLVCVWGGGGGGGRGEVKGGGVKNSEGRRGGGVKDRIGVPDMYGNLKGAPQLAYVIAHAQMVSSGQFMPCARLFVLI